MKRLIAPLIALALVGGCSSSSERPPKSAAEAKDLAVTSRDAVKAARETKDFKAARQAVARAQQASDFAKGILAKPPVSPDDNARCSDALAAAAEAERLGDLAGEEELLAGKVAAMNAASYRNMRDVAVQLSFMSLVRAARQAKTRSLETPPRAPKLSATVAADVASYCGRANLPSGATDWDGVAADMETMGSDQPPVVRLIFTLGFMVGAKDVLALYEIESIDPQLIRTSGERSLYHLLRSALLSRIGLTKLSVEEAERSAAALDEDPAASGREWRGAARAILACACLSQRDLARSDAEIARATQIWPENPLMVVLPGERLAAEGQYERAAALLEAAASATKAEWLAKKLSARAKELREKKGAAPPLFADSDFLCDVLSSCIAANASAPAPKQLSRLVAGARWLAQKIAENMK